MSEYEKLGVGHYRVDGKDMKFALSEGKSFEWERTEHQTELTDSEEKKIKAFGFDRDKFLVVKGYLEREMSKMAIHKETTISRSAIDKYQKNMSKKDMKIH